MKVSTAISKINAAWKSANKASDKHFSLSCGDTSSDETKAAIAKLKADSKKNFDLVQSILETFTEEEAEEVYYQTEAADQTSWNDYLENGLTFKK